MPRLRRLYLAILRYVVTEDGRFTQAGIWLIGFATGFSSGLVVRQLSQLFLPG